MKAGKTQVCQGLGSGYGFGTRQYTEAVNAHVSEKYPSLEITGHSNTGWGWLVLSVEGDYENEYGPADRDSG